MVAVPVNHDVLVWAREERGLSVEDASVRLKIAPHDLTALERGDKLPTLGILERMAGQYRLPLASLLMPARLPPSTRPQLTDFRAFEGKPYRALSHETLLAIDDAFLYVDYLVELRDIEPFAIPGIALPAYALSDDPKTVADAERSRLRVLAQEQLVWSDDREAFLRWREVVESQGVYTYQLKLGADDTRGFAIWDERQIPAVVIDASEDGYQARIFTLWHEYAHILLRVGGISDQNRVNNVERFCNAFAAHFLLPRDAFTQFSGYVKSNRDVPWADHHITRIANKFKVSKSVVAIHLEELGLAKAGLYREMLAIWRMRKPKKAGGRATHIEKYANRLGTKHIEDVLDAVDRSTISRLDAYDGLRVKPLYFPQLRQEAASRRAAYGRRG